MTDLFHRLQALFGEGAYGLDTPAPPRRAWKARARHAVDIAALVTGWAAIAAVAYLGLVL